MNNKIMVNQTVTIFNNFCTRIKEIYNQDENVNTIITQSLELSDEDKINKLKHFYELYVKIDGGEELLKNRKNKLFSSKSETTHNFSLSLFGEKLTLKNILNSLEGDNRKYLWVSINVLINLMTPKKKVFNKILNGKIDESTNELISDIMKQMDGLNKENPLDNIGNIVNVIKEKYQPKIESGEINIDNIFTDLAESSPHFKNLMNNDMVKTMMEMMKQNGMGKPKKPETYIIDENFSTKDIKTGNKEDSENGLNKLLGSGLVNVKNMTQLNNLIESLNGGDGELKMDGIMDLASDMMSKMGGKKNGKKFKKTMNDMLKNMPDNFMMDNGNGLLGNLTMEDILNSNLNKNVATTSADTTSAVTTSAATTSAATTSAATTSADTTNAAITSADTTSVATTSADTTSVATHDD